MKRFISLALAMIMLLALCACGGGGSSATATPAPAATDAPATDNPDTTPDAETPDDNAPAADADRNGDGVVTIAYSAIAYDIAVLPRFLQDFLQAECDERDWDLVALSAEGDPMKQGEQINQLLQQDPDYFVLFPADPTLALDWADAIGEAGVPCVCVHTDVAAGSDGTPNANISAYAGPNNYTMAYDVAKAMIEKNGADAGLKIVQIGGVPVQSDYIERVAGFNAAVEELSNYEVLGIEWAYSSRSDAMGFMENFISTYGDDIDVLMGFDDDLTLGGVNALQEAGKTDVQVYSITGQKEAIQAIKDGKMTLTAYYSTEDTIAKIVECLEKIMAGETLDYYQYTVTPHITVENADDFPGEF